MAPFFTFRINCFRSNLSFIYCFLFVFSSAAILFSYLGCNFAVSVVHFLGFALITPVLGPQGHVLHVQYNGRCFYDFPA